MPPVILGKRRWKPISDHRAKLRNRVAELLAESRAIVRAAQAHGVRTQELDQCVAIYRLWARDLRDVTVRAQVKLAVSGISPLSMDRPFGAIMAHAFEPRDPQRMLRVRQIGAALDYLHRRHTPEEVVRERLRTEGFRHLAALSAMDSDHRCSAASTAGRDESFATKAHYDSAGDDDDARKTAIILDLLTVLRRVVTFH